MKSECNNMHGERIKIILVYFLPQYAILELL